METRQILAEPSRAQALIIWFHHRGPIPVIIGGWAVYFHNSYLGSYTINGHSYDPYETPVLNANRCNTRKTLGVRHTRAFKHCKN